MSGIDNGLVTRPGGADVATTLERLRAAIEAAGASVVAVVDHAAAAEKVGMALRPTSVVIFGNPKAGTPLMQVHQTAGLDLPLKVLVWRDEAGATQLTYAEPAWIARRHGIDPETPAVAGLGRALETIVAAAAQQRSDPHEQDLLDEALDESFPASDPPAMTEPG